VRKCEKDDAVVHHNALKRNISGEPIPLGKAELLRAKLPTKDEARRIAVNMAKVAELIRKP
jgi:hypothetical protein